jgi:hypothetical protein
MAGERRWNKSKFDVGGSRTVEFDFRDSCSFGWVLVLRAFMDVVIKTMATRLPSGCLRGMRLKLLF